MAVTAKVLDRFRFGNGWLNTIKLDIDGYDAAGETLRASELGMGDVHAGMVQPADGYVFYYDRANEKVFAYSQTAAAADGDPLESVKDDNLKVTTYMFVIGR